MDAKQRPMTFLCSDGVINFNKTNEFFTEICDIIRDISNVDAVESLAIYKTLQMISARLFIENPNYLTLENILKMLKSEIFNDENKEKRIALYVIGTEKLSKHDLFYQRFSQNLDVRKYLPRNSAKLFLKAWKIYTNKKIPDSL